MSKKIRDTIFIAFIVLFIVITVVTSLYASGYQFNLSWPPKFNRLLVKTGMLAAATTPSGATIYLNGSPQKNPLANFLSREYLTTPAKIKNLLPGEYDLRFVKDGYWPLEEKINIVSGQSTFAENISLFKNDAPYLIASSSPAANVSGSSPDLALSPNRHYLYLPGLAAIVDLKSGLSKKLATEGGAADSAAGVWLKNGNLFSGGLTFSPDGALNKNYREIIGADATDWLFEEATGRIYYRFKNSLAYWDGQSATTALSGENYLIFEPRGHNLFTVVKNDSGVYLKNYDLNATAIAVDQLGLPAAGAYRFIAVGSSWLNLYDDKNKTLYLIDPTDLNNYTAVKNVSGYVWLDNNQLIYSNDWEIYWLALKSPGASLLTRVGEKISALALAPSGKYLLFVTDKSLNALDLRTDLATALLKADRIGAPVLDEKNNLVYFQAAVNGSDGYYKLALQ